VFVILPHLLCAHFIGDYLLQSGWLASRKLQTRQGLLIHTGLIYLVSIIALAPYFQQTFLPVTVLFLLHTAQDALKARLTPYWHGHLAWTYFADQTLHLLVIVGIAAWVGDDLAVPPLETFSMAFLAAWVVVTRCYEVTWWANCFELIPYMARWQVWLYLEHTSMLVLASFGELGLILACCCALPRLLWAWARGVPLWQQRYGLLEWALGILLCLTLGFFGLQPFLR